VVGLDCITGLQTARILARRGIPVIATASDPKHFCTRTRVCERILHADTKSGEFIHHLEELGPNLRHRAVLFPCTDLAVLHISRQRKRLEPFYHAVLPEPDAVEMLMDKASFFSFAQRHGLPVPATWLLATREDAEEASAKLRFPCILKPSLKSPAWEEQGFTKVYRAGTAAELLRLYDRLSPWTDVLTVQEWVEGDDSNLFSCNCYLDESSTPLVTFVARKIRQWPPGAGTSSLGEECRNDVVLREAVRLFQAAGFRGLGYVEMKRHAGTGEHFIIEPNVGRPTGRSAIAEAGGVELLYTMYSDAVGLPLPENRDQRYVGTKWIYLRHDIQSALHYWRRRELTLSQWRRSWRGVRSDAVFAWGDQAPFWHDLWQTAGALVGLRSRKRKKRAADLLKGIERT
jgi:D-aspartate ligase